MAHFAELDSNNRVLRVVCVANSAIVRDGEEDASLGVAMLTAAGGHGRWVQTSYNGKMRKRYAAIGMTYDETRDAFLPPKPFPSWVLDEQTCSWTSPTPRPATGSYRWREEDMSWVPVSPPALPELKPTP